MKSRVETIRKLPIQLIIGIFVTLLSHLLQNIVVSVNLKLNISYYLYNFKFKQHVIKCVGEIFKLLNIGFV